MPFLPPRPSILNLNMAPECRYLTIVDAGVLPREAEKRVKVQKQY